MGLDQHPGHTETCVNTEYVSQLHSNLYKRHHLTAEYNEKLEWYDHITLPFRQNTKEHC